MVFTLLFCFGTHALINKICLQQVCLHLSISWNARFYTKIGIETISLSFFLTIWFWHYIVCLSLNHGFSLFLRHPQRLFYVPLFSSIHRHFYVLTFQFFTLCVLNKDYFKNRHDHNKLDVCIILFEQYWLTFPIKITKTTCYLKSTQRSYALEIYVLTNLGTGRKCYMLEPVNMITSFPYKLIVPNYQIKWLLNLIYDIVVT